MISRKSTAGCEVSKAPLGSYSACLAWGVSHAYAFNCLLGLAGRSNMASLLCLVFQCSSTWPFSLLVVSHHPVV